MTISALPTPPNRADSPDEFASRADALLAALPTFVTEANALQADVNADAQTAAEHAGIAVEKADIAVAQASAAAASASTALSAPGTSATSTTTLAVGTGAKSLTIQTGKSLSVGMSVVIAATASPANRMSGFVTGYDSTTGALDVESSAASGSGSFSAWTVSLGGIPLQTATQAEMEAGTEPAPRAMSPSRVAQAIAALGKNKIVREAITTNRTLAVGDFGKLIDFNGNNNAALDFPAASELGNGWNCIIRNSGTGDLLMGAEVIGSELITNGNLSVDIVGSNVVVNGDFAAGSNWTSSAGWSISAGVATATTAQDLTANVSPLTVGTWYLVTYTVVTRTAGTVNIRLGETLGLNRTTTGTYTEILQCVGTGELRIQGNGTFSGSVDNVIVRPYNAGWIVGGNVLFNPRFENGGEGWTVPGGTVTFADGSATFTAGTSTVLELDGYTANSTAYRVSFTVSNYTAGTIAPSIHGVNGTAVSANGNYVQYITASTTTANGFRFTGAASFRGTISNVVVSRRVESSAVPVTYDGTNFELDISSLTVDTVAGPEQIIPALVAGGIYELTYEVKNWTDGGIAARVGTNVLTTRSANGTYTERFIAKDASTRIQFVAQSSAFTGSIDNVSLRRITAAATAPDTDVTTSPWCMYSGEVRLLQSDGTNLRTIVLNPFYKAFTQSGPFIKPPGYTLFQGLLWGGGASGAKGNSGSTVFGVTGGGGGACAPFTVPASALGVVTTIIVGSGGAAVYVSVSSGIDGGNSSFGSFVEATGGSAGTAQNDLTSGQTGSSGGSVESMISLAGYNGGRINSSGTVTYTYWGGGSSQYIPSSGSSSAILTTIYGGAGGGSRTNGAVHPATLSRFGGAGGESANGTNAGDGAAPGGGGGGQFSTTGASGAGARGELRIWGVV